jgi:phenylalanyl-tRNA synthetase beta chain
MEYSLYNLNQSCNLDKLTLTNLVNKLNLIGFEVDEIFIEELKTNPNLNNIRLLIKIPSNREDLLNENYLKQELAKIFLFDLRETWGNLKQNYSFLLKQRYIRYYDYDTIPIHTTLSNILMYNIELNQCEYVISPNWLKNKLTDSGLLHSSNLNDLLNLVVFEWGQTLNIFSLSTLISINDLYLERINEPIIFSHKKEVCLEKGTIVLKTKTGEILTALGIFNSIPSPIEPNKFFLQGCFYDIHENPLNLNTINTKISLRFLRKSYLETLKFAFQRFLTLLELLTRSKISFKKYTTIQTALELKSSKLLKLKKKVLQKLLNIEEIELSIFQKANLKLLCKTQTCFYFQIPTFRKDLTREIDLIEEYSRFVGYKNFQEIFPVKQLVYYPQKKLSTQFTKQFFLNYGFTEVITTSLEEIKKTKFSSIKINNPLNNELVSLRYSLLGKMIEIFENNTKAGNINSNYFQIGRVFKNSERKIIEQDKLAGLFQLTLSEKTGNISTEWFKAKGFVELFLSNFGYENLEIEASNQLNSYYHPTKTVILKNKGRILGKFGEINPLTTNIMGIKTGVYVFELNFQYLQKWKMSSGIILYEEYSKYPLVIKDLSFSISQTREFSTIKKKVREISKELKNVEFFDIYFEENNENSVNVGLRLEFQSKTKTLLTETIETEMKNIKKLLMEEFDGQFRE